MVCWSLSDEKMARSLNDLSKSTQRLPRSLNDRPVISMVATVSQSFDSVQNNLSMIAKGSDLSTNAQQTLNECSMISAISQWSQRSFNKHQIFPPEGDMAERSTRAQGSLTEMAFSLLLRDCWEIGPIFLSLNGRSTISILCKGLLNWCRIHRENNQNKILISY